MVKHTFTFPESMGGAKVILRELTAEEVIQLMDAFGDKPGRLGDEMVKKSLIAYGAKQLDDPVEKERVWAELPLKQRNMITAAYMKVTTPEEEELGAFFDSHESSVS